MLSKLYLFFIILEISGSVDLYEDEVNTVSHNTVNTVSQPRAVSVDYLDFEPKLPINMINEKTLLTKNLNCEDFSKYAVNCTMEAALIYNSSRKSPPMPAKMNDWCRAIRHLTNCAIDWNSECKDVTESHFNEDSIKGHMHVVNHVCDDEWFISRYDELPECIEIASTRWEACYTAFKGVVDRQKNSSQEWTHYITHFLMCCARTRFRRCTLDTLFDSPGKCAHDHAITMQKFSVIVSEGDVMQDCDHHIMYLNCPGGDPRPNERTVKKLMSAETIDMANVLLENVSILWSTLLLVYLLN